MAMTRANIPLEVTFITPDRGAMEIRMSEHTPDAIRAAAKALKAAYFVGVCDWCHINRLPVWGVFKGAELEPIKVFTVEDSKPAVIFAMMQGSR